ncbi:MAG: oligosaccharide flippase family protein [Candidatus Eisenbacteria sp.]|nr:oligosaccharide flippase family protein [Candidatus Eisenbacteria bacterium]
MSGRTILPPDRPPEQLPLDPGRGKDSVHRRLTLNSISNTARLLISLVVAFFLTPFVVHRLGDAAYGFWVVVLSFVGYAGLLELGVQPAVVRMVGFHRGASDARRLSEVVSTALVFFAGVGLLAALVLAFVVPPLVPRLINDYQGFPALRMVMLLMAADVLILYLNYLFTGVLYGWQLYHAKNLIDVAVLLINAAILVAFLSPGGLVIVAGSKALTDLLALVATITLCRRVLPQVAFAPWRVGPRSLRELLGFGGRLFLSASAARIADHAQPLIISSQASAAATAHYAIPLRLVDYTRQIAWSLSTPFMPMFSELDGQRDEQMIRSIYLRYSRYILFLTLPIVGLIFVYGRAFIAQWIGPVYAQQGGTALYLLAGGVLAHGLQPLIWRLFIGVGRLNFLVIVSVSTSLGVVLLGFLLVGPLGISGVALSVLVTAWISQVILFVHTSRYLGVSVGRQFIEVQARPLLIGAVFTGLAALIAGFLGSASYGQMAAGVGLAGILYGPMLYVGLHAAERKELKRILRDRIKRGPRAVE